MKERELMNSLDVFSVGYRFDRMIDLLFFSWNKGKIRNLGSVFRVFLNFNWSSTPPPGSSDVCQGAKFSQNLSIPCPLN